MGSNMYLSVLMNLKKIMELKETDMMGGGVIYSTYPVVSYKLYYAKLNTEIDALFQRPKENVPDYGLWFHAQVIGIKTLSNIDTMKVTSRDAGLS